MGGDSETFCVVVVVFLFFLLYFEKVRQFVNYDVLGGCDCENGQPNCRLLEY